MSAEWKGNLRNTVGDVFIDSALVVFTVCAYIPQITRLRQDNLARGISPYYILFNVFFSNAQLSELLLIAAYAWPTAASPVLERMSNGGLKSVEAFGAVLGLLQVFVQWSCSIAVLTLYAHAGGRNGRSISTTAFLHTAVVLFPVFAITLPHPVPGHTFAKDVLMALIAISNFIVAPCSLILQFYAQFRELKAHDGEPGALSLLSLALHVLATGALGWRWFLRLGHPTWEHGTASIWLWYHWGFPAINYVLYALGYAFLLGYYLFAARGRVEYVHGGAQAPLLR